MLAPCLSCSQFFTGTAWLSQRQVQGSASRNRNRETPQGETVFTLAQGARLEGRQGEHCTHPMNATSIEVLHLYRFDAHSLEQVSNRTFRPSSHVPPPAGPPGAFPAFAPRTPVAWVCFFLHGTLASILDPTWRGMTGRPVRSHVSKRYKRVT